MVTAMLLRTFSIWALLSLAGVQHLIQHHRTLNYNVFAGTQRRSASVEHSHHHLRVKGNYGFYLPIFDHVFRTTL